MSARALAHAQRQQEAFYRRVPPPQPRQRDYLDLASVILPAKDRTHAIQREIADRYGLSVLDLLSDRRAPSVAKPRQVAMYLCRELTTLSLPAIGKRFGNRDHSTVIHAIRRVEQRLEAGERELIDIVQRVRERVA